MQSSKLLQVLKTLNKREFRQFGVWIEGDIFHNNPALRQFFQFLVPFYPSFDSSALERDQVIKRFLPKEKNGVQKLRYLMSDLNQLLESFLVWTELKKNERVQNQLLLQSYKERQLPKHFNNVYEKHKKKEAKNAVKDMDWHRHQLDLEILFTEFQFTQLNHGNHDCLTRIMDHLDIFYIANKLKYACEITNYKNILATDYEPMLMGAIDECLALDKFKDIPVIYVYFLVLETLRDNTNEAHYHALVEYLRENKHAFDENDIYELYIYARNYCTKQINLGNEIFQKESLLLYKYLIEKDILIKEGYIWQWDYLNVTMISLRAGDFDYTSEFIRKYKEKIRPAQRQNAYTYCLAQFYFHTQKFEKCMDLLRDVEFSDPYYYMATKSLLAKTFFETEEIISLFSLTDAFSIYLRRNKKISKYQIQNHLHFVKFIKKMTRIKMGSRMRPEKVKKELTEISNIVDRTWLNEKLDELILADK